ncbi:MAG: hypothetical protein HYY93_08335 [Planctomycetes bacterium]|nr:hypothetical protein [Planctomycetota bacterium]
MNKPYEASRLLRETVLPALARRAPYTSTRAVRLAISKAKAKVQPATINHYLQLLCREGVIFDAGRGWYSFLKDPVRVSPEPVAGLVGEVRKAFPLLRFAAWSTAQVNPWMHHLIGQPVAVLDVEKDALDSVANRLEAANWKPAVNPRGESARRFAPHPRAVIVRALHSAAPQSPDGYATPEQLLVELRLEVEALSLMPVSEYRAMATRMAIEGRFEMASVVSYATKRRVPASELFINPLSALL